MDENSKELWIKFLLSNSESSNIRTVFKDIWDSLFYEYKTFGKADLIKFLLENKQSINHILYSVLEEFKYSFPDNADFPFSDEDKLFAESDEANSKTVNNNLCEFNDEVNNLLLEIDNKGKTYFIEHILTSSETKKDDDSTSKIELGETEEEDILKKAKLDYENEIKSYIEEQLNNQRICMQKDFDDELKKLQKEYPGDFTIKEQHKAMIDSTNSILAEICKFSNELNSIREYMNDAQSNIDDVQHSTYQKMHEWQMSLYPQQYKPIVRAFNSFYKNKERAKKLYMDIVAESAAEKLSESLINRISVLYRGLEIAYKQFEYALNCFDISVYYPKAGEPFDEFLHEDTNDSLITSKKVIKSCITPGIWKTNVFGIEPDVLSLAEVETITQE